MGGPCSGKVSPTVQLLLSGSNYNPERGTGNRVLAERRMALSKDGCRWRHSPPPWLHPASASACSPHPPLWFLPTRDCHELKTLKKMVSCRHSRLWSVWERAERHRGQAGAGQEGAVAFGEQLRILSVYTLAKPGSQVPLGPSPETKACLSLPARLWPTSSLWEWIISEPPKSLIIT